MKRSCKLALLLFSVTSHESWGQSCSVIWAPTTGASHDRFGHAMAFDAARQRTVSFGGQNGSNTYFGDTWTWNGSTWTLRSISGPSPRTRHAMAYDSARSRVVLFGGTSPGIGELGDTWEWDGNQWTQIATGGATPREAHAMAYDAARQRVVLHGGNGPNMTAATWVWDGFSWMVAAEIGPLPRYLGAMAYDSARQRVVMFGGQGADADTWEWDGSSWTLRSTFGPTPRWGHAMAYDSVASRIFMFGGAGISSQTWEWDGIAWSQWVLSPSPNGRHQHGMAFDSARGRLVMFGGMNSGVQFDTWELQGAGAPTISRQPLAASVYLGQRATFAIAASSPGGGGIVAYQWRRNGSNLTDGLRILGSQSPVLVVDNITSTDTGSYDVVVSNGCGQVVSAVVPLSIFCYPNCDGSASSPLLTANDFQCFLNKYASGCP